MKIHLKDQTFFISGTFKNFRNKGAARDAIHAAGAKTTASIANTTTALVLASVEIAAQEGARARGLHILNEEQLMALLADGVITVADAAPAEEAPRDAHIGELRGVFAQGPSSAAWDAIIQAVDQCPPAQQAELVAYIEAQISRWELDPHERWLPTDAATASMRDWRATQPAGELRCAPLHWIVEMLRGEELAKFGLVRGITLEQLKAKNAELTKLLKLTSLTNLRALNMGGIGSLYTPTIWKVVRDAPATRGLTHLRICALKDADIKQLGGPHRLDALRHLTLQYYYWKFERAALDALLQLGWARQLDTITLENAGSYGEHFAANLASLPDLKRVNFYGGHSWGFAEVAAWKLHGVEVGWVGDLYSPNELDISASSQVAPRGVTLLDLSGLRINTTLANPAKQAETTRDTAAWMLKYLPGSALLGAIPAIKLGQWWSEPLVTALRRPGLTITR
jgi:hypothetical protein